MYQSRNRHHRYSVKKMLLKISKVHRKKPVLESLFTKVAGLLKLQVFSCEFCEVFKNSLFDRTPPVVASVTRKLYQKLSTTK